MVYPLTTFGKRASRPKAPLVAAASPFSEPDPGGLWCGEERDPWLAWGALTDKRPPPSFGGGRFLVLQVAI